MIAQRIVSFLKKSARKHCVRECFTSLGVPTALAVVSGLFVCSAAHAGHWDMTYAGDYGEFICTGSSASGTIGQADINGSTASVDYITGLVNNPYLSDGNGPLTTVNPVLHSYISTSSMCSLTAQIDPTLTGVYPEITITSQWVPTDLNNDGVATLPEDQAPLGPNGYPQAQIDLEASVGASGPFPGTASGSARFKIQQYDSLGSLVTTLDTTVATGTSSNVKTSPIHDVRTISGTFDTTTWNPTTGTATYRFAILYAYHSITANVLGGSSAGGNIKLSFTKLSYSFRKTT